ncbi:hypothetical protein HYW87_01375 [Candidatus Roizmanbacteria bacterium]|nr:hypothetical protein [Candidatus Roizmanbacteria bacterium]
MRRFVPLILIVLVAAVLLGGIMILRGGPKRFGPQNQGYQSQGYQSGEYSSLESSKQYLRENGIDCTHENTYSTYKSLSVDPQNPNVLYVGVEGRGVYKSEDKGLTWQRKINGIVVYPDSNDKNQLCFPDISWIYIDPVNSKRLLLITSDITTGYIDWPYGETGGIWESLDGGDNWRQIISGKINVAGSGTLAVDPKNPNVIYYPVNPDAPTFKEAPIKESLITKGSVYKTIDGGKNWEEMTLPMLSGLQAMRIFIDPKNSNHLLFFTQSHDHIYHENGSITEVFLDEQRVILETFDGGKTWNSWSERLPIPYRALFEGDISLNNFAHMFVRPFLFGPKFPPEETQQKSFYSIDGGKTFQQIPYYIWVARYDPYDQQGNHLIGFASENSQVVESKDGGKTWERIGTPPELATSKVRVSYFAWDPKDPNTVYMSGDYGNVWKSIDGGKSWNNILDLNKLPR